MTIDNKAEENFNKYYQKRVTEIYQKETPIIKECPVKNGPKIIVREYPLKYIGLI